MAKAAVQRRRVLQERTTLEKILLVLLIVITYLLLASLFRWWPANSRSVDLGTAFYVAEPGTVVSTADQQPAASTDTSGGSGSTGGGSNTGGSNGGGGGGTTTPPAATTSPLLTFAAGVDTGNTKEQVSGQASGLNESCAVVVNASPLGKQEVCVYTEGDKIVTVTYLNDRVVSASRSGF